MPRLSSVFILTVLLAYIHQTVAALAVHVGEYVEDKIIYHVPSPGVIIAVAIAVFGQYRFATFQSTRGAFTSPSSVALVFAIFMLAYFFDPPEAGPLRFPLQFYHFVRRGQTSQPQPRPHRAHPVSAGSRWHPRPAFIPAVPALVLAARAQAHTMQRESVLLALLCRQTLQPHFGISMLVFFNLPQPNGLPFQLSLSHVTAGEPPTPRFTISTGYRAVSATSEERQSRISRVTASMNLPSNLNTLLSLFRGRPMQQQITASVTLSCLLLSRCRRGDVTVPTVRVRRRVSPDTDEAEAGAPP